MLEQLPLICEPAPGESGLGYCLRSVCRNGLNLHWLRQAAGIGYRKHLDGRYAAPLSWILQCQKSWLVDALPRYTTRDATKTWLYCGHAFRSYNHLRIRCPQICPRCIHEDGFCRAVWELAPITVCLRHECALVDACSRCGAPLRWDRPAIDICNCGRPFGSRAHQRPAPALLEVTGFMEATFNRRDAAGLAPRQLPSFLGGLSLHGLLSLIHAFGVLEGDFSPASPASQTKVFETSEWSSIVLRVLGRLEWAGDSAVDGQYRLEPVVSRAVLQRLALSPDCEADREVALSLLRSIFSESFSGQMGGKRPQLSQLPLFE